MKSLYPFIVVFIVCYSFYFTSENKLTIVFENQPSPIYRDNEFIELANEIFRYESSRILYDKDLRVHVSIRKLPKDYRGGAQTNQSEYRISLSKDSIKNKTSFLGIFAHELAHIVLFDTLKAHTNNHYWDEGFATWLAGKYFLEWHNHASFNDAMKYFINSNKYIDIKNLVRGDDERAHMRDILYLEWAAFIDYLYSKFGIKKIIELNTQMVSYEARRVISIDKSNLYSVSTTDGKHKLDKMQKDNKVKVEGTIKKFNSAYYIVYGTEFEDLKSQWLKSYEK